MFQAVALIAIYDHGSTIADVVRPLRQLGLPCRIVDDGSASPTQSALAELARSDAEIVVWTLPRNAGRGAALAHGFERVHAEGFTHAVVLDADGQHETRDVPRFIEAARVHPQGLVLGSPRFGADAPLGRLWGRQLSRFWVWVETLSFAIDDPLCGFRCYPLQATLAVLHRRRVGVRMDFDPEIAVRLSWSGAPIVNVPTDVRYPNGGISHFRMLRDNLRITWMHSRLCGEMLVRLPRLLLERRHRRREVAA